MAPHSAGVELGRSHCNQIRADEINTGDDAGAYYELARRAKKTSAGSLGVVAS